MANTYVYCLYSYPILRYGTYPQGKKWADMGSYTKEWNVCTTFETFQDFNHHRASYKGSHGTDEVKFRHWLPRNKDPFPLNFLRLYGAHFKTRKKPLKIAGKTNFPSFPLQKFLLCFEIPSWLSFISENQVHLPWQWCDRPLEKCCSYHRGFRIVVKIFWNLSLF